MPPLVDAHAGCYTSELPRKINQAPQALSLRELKKMKENIHPQYFETVVTCGCGNRFQTRSTRKELKVDICNACHPFYTGKLKYVDTAGRIEKFQTKFAAGSYFSQDRPKKKR
jgi:large subunit ribosomal protein L31